MRKLFFLFLALVATTSLWAQRFQVGDLYYNITSSSVPYAVEVTYERYLSSYNYSSLTTAIIPETITYNGTTYSVTSIGERAFQYCTSLTSITIPNSVTSIGGSAFSGCYSLTSITIPNSVTSIGRFAFSDCDGLTLITIPNSVTSIGEYAFHHCSFLTYITIPNSVTSIGEKTFASCKALTSVSIPNSVTSIGDGAFSYCSSLTSITIPNSVTSIGSEAFRGCSSLTSPVYNAHCFAYLPTSFEGTYTVPDGIKQIAGGAFYECFSLTSVTIPNSVTSIGEWAFWGCSSLTSITIPNSVTSIGDAAFYNCSSLTTPVYNAHCFAYMLTSFKGAYVIPEGIKQIAGGAFAYCSSLTSITIPNSVTSIGDGAFYYCSNLTDIIWNAKKCSDFSCKKNGNKYVSEIFESSNIKSFTFGNDVEYIPAYLCFLMSNLTSVIIPNSVTNIGEGAFYSCSSLDTVTCLAMTPPALGEKGFYRCDNPTLFVPCEALSDYQLHEQWGQFTNIECIASEEAETEEVVIESGTTTVIITWPTEEGADTYTIVIKKDGKVVCTLTFNSEGQLISIAFAPGRDGNHPAQYAEAVANGGYRFTVTGLEEGTHYTYNIDVKNTANQTINSHTGAFTTQSTTAVENTHSQSPMTNCQKLLRDGQLIILRDGVEYNAMGAQIQ